MSAASRGSAGLLNRPEFVPYVYGAASGCPSRGRPEKVLGRLKAMAAIREDRVGREGGSPEVNGRLDGRTGRVTARNAMPGQARNGMPEPGGYVYRGTGEDTLTAGLTRGRLEHEVRSGVQAPAPAPPAPPAAAPAPQPGRKRRGAVLTTACPGCGRPKPDRYATCAGAGPCLAPRRAPEPEPMPAPVPAPVRRRETCGYLAGTVGHQVVCGDAG